MAEHLKAKLPIYRKGRKWVLDLRKLPPVFLSVWLPLAHDYMLLFDFAARDNLNFRRNKDSAPF